MFVAFATRSVAWTAARTWRGLPAGRCSSHDPSLFPTMDRGTSLPAHRGRFPAEGSQENSFAAPPKVCDERTTTIGRRHSDR